MKDLDKKVLADALLTINDRLGELNNILKAVGDEANLPKDSDLLQRIWSTGNAVTTLKIRARKLQEFIDNE